MSLDTFFKGLEIVKRDKPSIFTLTPQKGYLDPYNFFIRFWGRIPTYLLEDIFSKFEGKILFDPFGGSGAVIFSAIDNGFKRIIYNDINPAFVFLTRTIANSLNYSPEEIKKRIESFNHSILVDNYIRSLITFNGKLINKIGFCQMVKLRRTCRLRNLPGIYSVVLKKVAKTLTSKKNVKLEELRQIKIAELKNYPTLIKRALITYVINRLLEEGIIKKEEKVEKVSLEIREKDHDYKKIILSKRSEIKEFEKFLRSVVKNNKRKIIKKVFETKLKYENGKKFLKAENIEKIGDLYPSWSQIVLSVLWKKILTIKDPILKDILKLIFISTLYDASKMQMFHKSGWIIKSFWIPPNFAVKNPIEVFIKKANIFLQMHKKYFSRKKCKNILFLNRDILEIEKLKPKPDIIVTHPPYFSTVQYGELSMLWNAWLDFKVPFEKEIVVNRNQKKNKEKYVTLLRLALNRILKLSQKNSTLILIFQSKKVKDWKLLDRMFLDLPIKLEEIRRYERKKVWNAPSNIFNIGKYDYALIFKKTG